MNQIYFVGYDAVHPQDFVYDIPEGFHNYLLILTTTPALFCIDGTVSEFPAHTAVLYPPDHSIWYGAAGKPYGNHWLRFLSDESFVTGFPQPGIPFSISDPEYCRSLFQLLTWETSQLVSSSMPWHNTGIITMDRDAHLYPQKPNLHQTSFVISQLLGILFEKLHADLSSSHNSGYEYELLSLRRKISAAPEQPWNVADMAGRLHISPGHLQLIYRQKFGVSCMEDVISFRLFKARDLLANTTLSISEIASGCGYNNTEHFCRQFRKNIGVSPGQYRKNL